MKDFNFKTTKEIEVPKKLVDQVIGQDKAIEIIKKASIQRRNVILVGPPGTGKSLIGQALAELLPKQELTDVLCYPNIKDENMPLIKEVPAGKGREIIDASMSRLLNADQSKGWTMFMVLFLALAVGQFVLDWIIAGERSDILRAADRISGTLFLLAIMLILIIVFVTQRMRIKDKTLGPKIIVDNGDMKTAPFIDATGAHEGALLGDVKHDPLQTGGLGTPAHERVIAGDVHKANKGVLFIDEIATLNPESQIALLSAMQEKRLAITGRGERSSGAMTKTQPVPTDFVLVAAGNVETIRHMHPALRSRIRGYGYEIYMDTEMDDTPENREKLARFIAQEIKKDNGKTPHFTREAVIEVVKIAKKTAGRSGKLTTVFRELGGVIRASGDLARERGHELVNEKDVKDALKIASSLEQQLSERYIKLKKDYEVIQIKGSEIGKVNGLAVLSADSTVGSGIIMPIEAAVVPSMKKGTSSIIATGRLGQIAKEAVKNVSAIIKKYSGKDTSKYDIHIQFIQAFEGVEGDSASISVATAMLSSLEGIPVKQDIAMTGSLSIRGEVLPVGGINPKIEAAIEAGIKKVIIPKMNVKDVLIDGEKIEIIPVETIADVIKYSFDWKKGNKKMLAKIKRVIK